MSVPWAAGSALYRGLRRIDAARGVASWDEALAWIDTLRAPIRELQYWGHGKWGCAMIDDDPLDASRIARLAGLRERLAPDALVWFRTCETFGARRGQEFAARLADFLGARVAGHTYIIGFHQSGLHGLAPGRRPDWAADEGLAEGTADAPKRAQWSTPFRPRTITCFHNRVPKAWFADCARNGHRS
jgi:hypothetical protein